jgi:hypothetical protein
VLLKITVEQNGVILDQSIVKIDDDESLSVAIKSAVDTVRAQDPSKPLWGLGIKVDKLIPTRVKADSFQGFQNGASSESCPSASATGPMHDAQCGLV